MHGFWGSVGSKWYYMIGFILLVGIGFALLERMTGLFTNFVPGFASLYQPKAAATTPVAS